MGPGPAKQVREASAGMVPDVQLAGIVAHHHGVAQEPMRRDGAPERAFGGDAHGIRRHLEAGEAECSQMGREGRLIGELPDGMVGQQRQRRARQRALPHVGQRRVVDDVVRMSGAQALQEVEPALRPRGPEPGEVVVADLRAEPVAAPVARPGIVDRDPAGGLEARPQHVARLVVKQVLAVD